MMTKSSAALVALPLAATLLLAGCGDDKTRPQASSSSTTTANSTTSSPTPSSSPTTGTTTSSTVAAPSIPAAARAHTAAGAEAFTRYFFTQLNVSWSKPQAGLIAAVSRPTCKTCDGFEKTAKTSVANGERVVGDSVVLEKVAASDATKPDSILVLATGYQPATKVISRAGEVVEVIPRESTKAFITVEWIGSRWLVAEIRGL